MSSLIHAKQKPTSALLQPPQVLVTKHPQSSPHVLNITFSVRKAEYKLQSTGVLHLLLNAPFGAE